MAARQLVRAASRRLPTAKMLTIVMRRWMGKTCPRVIALAASRAPTDSALTRSRLGPQAARLTPGCRNNKTSVRLDEAGGTWQPPI